MKRDLDRFTHNLNHYDQRKKSNLRSLATEKAEIEKYRESYSQISSRSISHPLYQ